MSQGERSSLFEFHPRVTAQLQDKRLGDLAGRLSVEELQELVNSPSAQRFLDTRTGNINVIQEVQGKTVRVTVPRDARRIISVGPIRPNQIRNRIASGDFIPLP